MVYANFGPTGSASRALRVSIRPERVAASSARISELSRSSSARACSMISSASPGTEQHPQGLEGLAFGFRTHGKASIARSEIERKPGTVNSSPVADEHLFAELKSRDPATALAAARRLHGIVD